VVRIGGYAVVLALLAVAAGALAGCGGSSRRSTSTTSHPALFDVRVSPPPEDATRLPGSSRAPMTCTVYESTYATQVIFVSETFDVRAECRAWSRNRANVGYLWSYQPARASLQPTESRQVCYVADRAGIVAARVIEATGLRAASAAQAAHASSACTSLLASGWVRLSARRARVHR
jgi:hypothetical protein